MTKDETIERAVVQKGLTAPRVTRERIDEVIAGEFFWQPSGTTLTVCVLELANGTCVIGESACVSEENFDAELGRQIARDNAKNKVWALEGYLLKEKLANG